MFDQPLGRLMLAVAGISIFIGNVLIRKITSFRV
jgi:Flp pilus assembly protein TadB